MVVFQSGTRSQDRAAQPRAERGAAEQTVATSSILRVISSSPTRSSARVRQHRRKRGASCAAFSSASSIASTATLLHLMAHHGLSPGSARDDAPRISDGAADGKAPEPERFSAAPSNRCPDVARGSGLLSPEFAQVMRHAQRASAVPMMREGVAIGAIAMRPHAARLLPRTAGRAAPDIRRPGGHRDRERPPVRRGAGAQPRGDARRSSSRPRPARSCG